MVGCEGRLGWAACLKLSSRPVETVACRCVWGGRDGQSEVKKGGEMVEVGTRLGCVVVGRGGDERGDRVG